jgi:hypothetical protein
MAVKKGKRELIDTGSDKQYVTRNVDGTFRESDDLFGSPSLERAIFFYTARRLR